MDVSLQFSRSYFLRSRRPVTSVFPPEILLMILRSLGIKDLLTCSRVCKIFWYLINHAAELVYIIELAVSGYVDLPFSSMPAAHRLHMLRDLRARWAFFKPLKRQAFSLPHSRRSLCNVFAGGLFTQAIFSDDPDIASTTEFIPGYALPGRTRPFRDLGALIPDVATKLGICADQMFHIQPEIDLVVFFEHPDFWELYPDASDSDSEDEDDDGLGYYKIGWRVIRMVFRTVSSGAVQTHPACRAPNGVIEFVRKHAIDLYSHVAGSSFGVTFLTGGMHEVVIWNWHSGECIVHMTMNDLAQIWDFAFLSPEHFVLLMSGGPTEWRGASIFNDATDNSLLETLSLFSFGRLNGVGRQIPVTTGTVTHIVSLCLPKSGENDDMKYCLSTGPFCRPFGLTDMPFAASNGSAARIFVVDFVAAAMDEQGEDDSNVALVMHSMAFMTWGRWASAMQSVRTEDPVDILVPFEVWAPRYARLFTVKPQGYHGTFPHRSISGERVTLELRDEEGEDTAYVLDFNLRANKRALSASNRRAAAAVVSGSTTHTLPDFFKHPVTTALPYSAVKIPDHEPYHDFLLDEERLLCLKRERDFDHRTPDEIDVFVF